MQEFYAEIDLFHLEVNELINDRNKILKLKNTDFHYQYSVDDVHERMTRFLLFLYKIAMPNDAMLATRIEYILDELRKLSDPPSEILHLSCDLSQALADTFNNNFVSPDTDRSNRSNDRLGIGM